ncbi:hypothetical protein BCR44DRAFT_1451462 [Catenaria anguillulae PL171]|uniref:Uncharacterized protein n=1 Tax=Catenaria anguillulae PL171 TaxID=765915 RepID=A0A1Y2H465_9FUNG|nr:hypothetical protein BCR44DRAFT_1451462 [Catenaria anguillulae PL171]
MSAANPGLNTISNDTVSMDRVPIELWASILSLAHPRTDLVVSTRLASNAAQMSPVLRSWAYRLVFLEPLAPTSHGSVPFSLGVPIPSFQLETKLSKLLQSCLPCQPGDPVHGIVLQPKPGAGLARLPTDPPLNLLQGQILSLATWLVSDRGPYRRHTDGLGGSENLICSRLDSLHAPVKPDVTVRWQAVPDLLHLAVFAIRLGQPDFFTFIIQRLVADLFPNGQLTDTYPALPFTYWARLMLHDSHSIGSIVHDLASGSDADTCLSPVHFFLWLATADWSLALFEAIPAAFGVDYTSTVTQFVSMLANDPILWSICLNTLGLATDPDRITLLMDHLVTFKPNFFQHILSQASRYPRYMSVLMCANSHDCAVSMRLFAKYDLALIDQIKTLPSARDMVGHAILDYCFRGQNDTYLPVLFDNQLLDARELGLVLNRVVVNQQNLEAMRMFVARTPKDLLGEIVCQGINNFPSYMSPSLDYFASMANVLHASTMPFFRTISSRTYRWTLNQDDMSKVLFIVPQNHLAVAWDYKKLSAELAADPAMADEYGVVYDRIKKLTNVF